MTRHKILLYNLAEDPQELNDLSDDPQHAEVIARLFATFEKLQKETGDTMDLSSLVKR